MTTIRRTYLIIYALLLLLSACVKEQQPTDALTDNSQEMMVSPDISNQNVKAFAEDTLGHIWTATFRGVNKYDGHEYQQYFCTDDFVGLTDNNVNTLFRDSHGRLWAGTVNGPCFYTDQDRFQRAAIAAENRNCIQFAETSDGRVLLYNISEIMEYDEQGNRFEIKRRGMLVDRTFHGNIHIASDGRLWVGTPACLRRYDTQTYQLLDSIPLPQGAYYTCFQNNDEVWISGSGILQRFSLSKRTFEPVSPALDPIRQLTGDGIKLVHPYGAHGWLLLTARGRAFYFDEATSRLVDKNDAFFPFEMPEMDINTLFTDSQGNLWIGSTDKGARVIYNHKNGFNNVDFLNRSIGRSAVKSVVTDGKGNLFIATLSRGLFVYNTTNRQLKPLTVQTPTAEKDNKALHLYVAPDGDLWYGTLDAVLRCRYDGERLTVKQRWDVFMPLSFASDQQGKVWATTSSVWLYAFPDGQAEPEHLQLYPESFVFTPCIMRLDNGQLLIAAFNQKMLLVDPQTRQISKLPMEDGSLEKCIHRSVFIPVATKLDAKGNIWIGVNTNGVMAYSMKTHRVTPISGLSCNDITAIEEDEDGNMWISTMDGLNCYDPRTQKATAFYKDQGIGGNQFIDRSSCRLPDGTLVFGGTHGLTIFNPNNHDTQHHAPLVLEYLKIHNQIERPGGGAIETNLSGCKEIRLSHSQNSFSITYASLDYNDQQRTHYYYMLDGLDNDWHDAGSDHTAYYANLPAGKYTFSVRTSSDGKHFEPATSIDVIVSHHPLLSWWAWMLYLCIAAAIGWQIRKIRRRIAAEKAATRKAELEREQEARVNRMNMSFFANISHEFRTPLTMIAGPTDTLARDNRLPQDSKRLVEIVQRSVRRMLRLVNQLMDFNKLENDALRLHVEQTDIIATLRRICEVFTFNMEEKGIRFRMEGMDDSLTAWADEDKLDKMVGNLLSNALKFTPKGGTITVQLDVVSRAKAACEFPLTPQDLDDRYVKISVADSGQGIPEDQLEAVFRRYYQVDNQTRGTINWGTGIGLYYARRLATLHHGYIKAANQAEGTGAVFSILLPISTSSYTEEERAPLPDGQKAAYPIAPHAAHREDETETKQKDTVMVIDDDTEIADYLTTLLSPYYNVVARFDADSALKTLADHQPSLILSDVMMPGKDGYELCREVKNDIQLSHIPVILVTAKYTSANQVEGLDTGADAYVTKPFDPCVLLAQIRSLIKNRERARQVLGRATEADKKVEEVLSPQDKAFMEELYHLMEDELANSELDIVRITEMLHISRTKFYYKIKGLTGDTPAAFFRTYKLNRAAQLLRDGRYNVSEVANMTGFSTQSHFATLFKKQFGLTPTEFRG